LSACVLEILPADVALCLFELGQDRMDSFSRSSFYGTIGLSVIIVLLAAGMFWLTNRHSRQDKEEIFKLMVCTATHIILHKQCRVIARYHGTDI
jgi:bacteriorhodopsin